ncbi:hypothetical protein GEV33_002274 [Tenebrio molitor]|uniref:Uncharacterized protein n=1 Tax=Tenebrio molitor TaxID=7067 RepID=A0A8J6HTU1_TENMO|nr:hypothetical protein GEV33_002274 [Tenebrio molitor]
MKFPRAADDTCTSSVRYDIRERSDLSLLRRPSASCGVRRSAVLLPLRPLLTPVEMKKEGQKNRELDGSAGTGPAKEENAIKVTYDGKTVTYSVGVRSFFGVTKSQKKSVTPKIRKFRQSWGSKRYAIQYETENHATLLTSTGDFVKIPKIVTVLLRKRKSGIETQTYRLAQKSLTSPGEGKQTLTAVDRRNIENRQKNQNKWTKKPTPSIIDENRRSRPSPGVSGDEESRIEKFVKEEKKMSRDEKVKGIYGVGVLKKGKGQGSRPDKPDAASSAVAKRKENEEKPTRKTKREGKVERINDNYKRTGG